MRLVENNLLGFDAREMWSNSVEHWPEDRRRQSLFRLDVERPLSVDTEIWQSVFDADPHLKKPDWMGPVQELWDDLERLRAYLRSAGSSPQGSFWWIAVAVIPESCGSDGESRWRSRIGEIVPDSVDPSWDFLGYDVADEYLESGLSNRVFRPEIENADSLRKKWAPHLTEHHLFANADPALKFAALSDTRSPEHAPFCVFGVWRIREI